MRLLPFILTRVGARGIGAALQAGLFFLLARSWGNPKFGEFAVSVAVTGIVCVVSGMGVQSMALRIALHKNSQRTDQTLLWVGIPVVLAGSPLSLAGMAFTVGQVPSVVVVGASFFVAAEAANEVVIAWLSGHGRLHFASVLIVARRATVLLTVGVAALAGRAEVGVIAAAALVLAATIGYALRSRPPSLREVRLVLGEARGYWAATLSGQISSLDTPLIAAILGAAPSGLYAGAVRGTLPLMLVAYSLVGVFVPHLASASPQEFRNEMRKLFRIGLCLAAAFIGTSPVIGLGIQWALGPGFEGASLISTGMAISVGLSCLSQVHQAELIALGRPRQAASAIGLGAVLGILSLALGAWTFGPGSLPLWPPLIQTLILLALFVTARRIRMEEVSTPAEAELLGEG